MTFEEEINWAEGMFLQPHHLQQLQRLVLRRNRSDRALTFPYSYGLIDLEIDENALVNARVVVRRFSAVMRGGEEVSMPGNVRLAPLDLTPELAARKESFLVCLALPAWSSVDANLVVGSEAEKRQFLEDERRVRDENTGDNEIEVPCRRYNVCLTTDCRDAADLDLLPIMRLVTRKREGVEPSLEIDRAYVPPYLVLDPSSRLAADVQELLVQMRRRRAKLLADLTHAGYTTEHLGGSALYDVLQLQCINAYEGRLTSMLGAGSLSPFTLYLDLKALLGQLSALQPLRESRPPDYDHLNSGVVFAELLMQIRALILTEGISSYVRLDFVPAADGTKASVQLTDQHFVAADEYYLAVHCDADARRVTEAVEEGDNLRLVNPAAEKLRVRGVKLEETRFPPRFLPALPDTVWFRLNRDESPKIWDSVRTEHALLLDWASAVLPRLEASLYVTIVSKE